MEKDTRNHCEKLKEAQYFRKTGKNAGSDGDAAISMKVKLLLRNVLHVVMS